MKKQQVDHVLRAAGRITGEKQFIIIGSQSLHGKHPDLADDIVRSAEVDLIAKRDASRTEWLNVIGQDSKFHDQSVTTLTSRRNYCDASERLERPAICPQADFSARRAPNAH